MSPLLAIIIGRIISFIGKFVDRASHLPGRVALKICPDFLDKVRIKGKLIAVTGSNGKTTTTNLIAHILRENGYKVVCNEAGANLTAGVTTTIINNCNLRGTVKADFTVLESDERFSRFTFRYFSPDIFAVTNLLRDQVARNGNPDLVMDKINEAISDDVFMVLNANDPISMQIAKKNDRQYFSMERTSRSTNSCDNLTHDCKVCPNCFSKLDYNFYHFNHIGDFYCDKCGFKTPTASHTVTDADFENGSFKINGVEFKTDYLAPYHFMNICTAVSVCEKAGVSIENCVAPVKSFKVDKERYDEFIVDGRKVVLVLSKQNSVSVDQSIEYALSQKGDKTVVFFVNNVFYTDNKDASWIYDVSFEKLIGKVDKVVCAGSRALDVGIRMKLGGFNKEDLLIDTSLSNLKEQLKATKGDIYVLAATAFGDDDGILEVLKS